MSRYGFGPHAFCWAVPLCPLPHCSPAEGLTGWVLRGTVRAELRNEIIALFNLLAKLADSAHLVAEMSLLLTDPHHRAFEELTRPRLHQPANPSDLRGLASEKLLKMHAEL